MQQGLTWVPALVDTLEGAAVQTDPDVLASYARDQAPLAPAGTPAALVRARHVEDVVRTLRFANEHQIPVVTRAAGTGLAGGANAIDRCIMLSVLGLDRILSVDPVSRMAVVEPGVLNATLASAAQEAGLFYAPDPASREISTIGGNIATNAGGACCLKYGVTGDHVASLKVVLADGTIIRTGGVTKKNVAGLDLTRLMVGSEGTLGVVVEATLRLLRAPRPASTLTAFFESVEAAGAAIVEMDASLDLSLVEIMDRTTVDAVDKLTRMDLDTTAAAMVIVQSDAARAEDEVLRGEEICQKHGARDVLRTDDPAEGKLLLGARKMALPALEKMGTTLLDDVAVPKPTIPTMLERIRGIGAAHELVIGTFGHAGDGNLHPTIVFQHGDERSQARAFAAFDEILKVAMELGGTIAGEHGVGTLKQRYLQRMVGSEEQALMQRIKAAFDPRGVLNPGKAI